ncbi:MAG: radical SAM protein, partial [Anaerotignum sp.]|nr:radical SAM protein [Anaerotignum sp.]
FDEEAEKELFELLGRDYISGITFSGGDPLFEGNREAIEHLARKVKLEYPDKNIWLYTGYRWEEISALHLMQFIDVLVDGRFMEDLKDTKLHWKGSFNQRIIDVQKSLQNSSLYLYHAE